ncbi:MAG: AsmA-like C-terminal region-containing protein [Bacteroidales bacterium]|nr:AsmA-like C-terminal region-containing protein [Bacteroidales bacterium]
MMKGPKEGKTRPWNWKRYLLVAASLVAGVMLLLTLALYVMVYHFGDRIKDLALKEVNERLNVPVDVEAARLTLWPHFPRIALDLNNIRTSEIKSYPNQPGALNARHIYLIFDPRDIIRGEIRLRRIAAEEGQFNLIVFKNGSDNYHFFKSTDDSSANMEFTLDKVELKGIEVMYIDQRDDTKYSVFISQAELRGELSGDVFEADAKARLTLRSLRSGGTEFLSDLPLQFDSRLNINLESGGLNWEEGRFSVEGMNMASAGEIVPSENYQQMAFTLSSERADWETLSRFLPEALKTQALAYDPQAVFSFDFSVNGNSGDGMLPRIRGLWALSAGSMRVCDERKGWLTELSAEGSYDSGEAGDYSRQELKVKAFQGLLNEMPLRGSFRMQDFSMPRIQGNITSEILYSALPDCWTQDAGITFDGRLALKLSFNYDHSLYDSIQWTRCMDLRGNGSLTEGKYEDATLGISLQQVVAAVSLHGGNLHIEGLEATSPQGAVNGSLSLNGLLAFMESSANGLGLVLDLNAQSLPLTEWIESGSKGNEGEDLLPEQYSLDINLQVDRVAYKTFSATGISGNLVMNGGRLYARNLKMKTMDGELGLQGVLEPSGKGYQLRCMARLNDMNLTELFRQMDDFGQKDLTHKNISGEMNAGIELAMFLGEDLIPSPASILAIADLSIEQGIIRSYAPLMGLSRFIRVGNLDKVSIEPLKTRITIRDQKVFIPEMAVNSDAMNLVVSGVHGFDQRLDYSIQVLLSELWGRRAREARKENEEFGWVEDDGLGRTTLFMRVGGTMDAPVFSYDRREVARKIGQDLNEERKELGRTLKEEFHWLGRDSLQKVRKREAKDRLRRQESGEFILEWDSTGVQ